MDDKNYLGLRIVGTIFLGFTLLEGVGLFCLVGLNDKDLVVNTINIDTESSSNLYNNKILQLSDLHNHSLDYGNANLLAKLNEIKVSAAIKMIFITGDMVDNYTKENSFQNLEKLYQNLAGFNVPVLFCSGNHEWYSAYQEKSFELMEKYGFHILDDMDNKYSPVFTYNNVNYISFRDPHYEDNNENYMSRHEGTVRERLNKTMKTITNDYPNVLLAHRPELYHIYEEYNYSLIASGHTHGGIFDFNKIIVNNSSFIRGYYKKEKLYVNSGLGTTNFFNIRINVPSELTIFSFQ